MTALDDLLESLLQEGVDQRLFSGAAVGVSVGAKRAVCFAGTPSHETSEPIVADSLFDLASLTKTYTAMACMVLAERGVVALDAPVAEVMPVGDGPGAETITLRMLLRHTSGMPAVSEVWRDRGMSPERRLRSVIRSPLASFPDKKFTYSCPGYITIGALLEKVTGASLPLLFEELLFEPLGLRRTSFGPVPASDAVATEWQPYVGRGTVRGQVHDELSWSLGGATGNAGLFAPVADVLQFAESFLRGGVLSPESLTVMTGQSLSSSHGAAFGHGLGVRLGDAASMGTAQGFGHTGFTGTLWVADQQRDLVVVLLTNRVHPRREAVSILPYRRRVMDALREHLGE